VVSPARRRADVPPGRHPRGGPGPVSYPSTSTWTWSRCRVTVLVGTSEGGV
jgi:hypothetical protein